MHDRVGVRVTLGAIIAMALLGGAYPGSPVGDPVGRAYAVRLMLAAAAQEPAGLDEPGHDQAGLGQADHDQPGQDQRGHDQSGRTDDGLIDIGVAGGRITATAGHAFWLPDEGRWAAAGLLRAGQAVRTSAGRRAEITAVRPWRTPGTGTGPISPEPIPAESISTGPNSTGLSSASSNSTRTNSTGPSSTSLIAGGRDFAGYAHVISVHVEATDQDLIAHANDPANRSGLASRWNDLDTAQNAVDHIIGGIVARGPRNRITTWLRGTDQKLEIHGKYGPSGQSNGVIMRKNGVPVEAGNVVTMVLQRAPGHPDGYYVFTAYPSGVMRA